MARRFFIASVLCLMAFVLMGQSTSTKIENRVRVIERRIGALLSDAVDVTPPVDLRTGTTVGKNPIGIGGGAPAAADYLVGTANGSLSAEIVVGTTPGGELGGTWAAPTLDDTITVGEWTIDGLNLSAGSASAGTWPVLTAGTLLTTAEDGGIEQNADAYYLTTDAGNRGYVPVKNCIRADATRTLSNVGTTQALFNSPANGRLTLETGLYMVDAYISLSSMSATSGNFRFDPDGAGTATISDIAMEASGRDAAVNAAGSATGDSHWTGTGLQPTTNIITAAIGTGASVRIGGSFEVSVAGTIIPNLALTTAAAAVVDVGTYFCVERIGSTTMTNVGQWD